jgi:hypothetical protein
VVIERHFRLKFERSTYLLGNRREVLDMMHHRDHLNSGLALKMLIKEDPVGMITNCSFWLIGMSAYCLRVAESPVNAFHANSFWNQMWLVVVTMTTTGYGDNVPATHFGRFICVCLMVAGTLLVSMLTATATKNLELNHNEAIVVVHSENSNRRYRVTVACCRYLQYLVRIGRGTIKEDWFLRGDLRRAVWKSLHAYHLDLEDTNIARRPDDVGEKNGGEEADQSSILNACLGHGGTFKTPRSPRGDVSVMSHHQTKEQYKKAKSMKNDQMNTNLKINTIPEGGRSIDRSERGSKGPDSPGKAPPYLSMPAQLQAIMSAIAENALYNKALRKEVQVMHGNVVKLRLQSSALQMQMGAIESEVTAVVGGGRKGGGRLGATSDSSKLSGALITRHSHTRDGWGGGGRGDGGRGRGRERKSRCSSEARQSKSRDTRDLIQTDRTLERTSTSGDCRRKHASLERAELVASSRSRHATQDSSRGIYSTLPNQTQLVYEQRRGHIFSHLVDAQMPAVDASIVTMHTRSLLLLY